MQFDMVNSSIRGSQYDKVSSKNCDLQIHIKTHTVDKHINATCVAKHYLKKVNHSNTSQDTKGRNPINVRIVTWIFLTLVIFKCTLEHIFG